MLTNKMHLPQQFVDAVTTDYTPTPKRFSATTLLKGTREILLQRRHHDEIEQDVSEMVWLLFGTAVHTILERAKETDTQLKETFISAEADNGYTVSGVFDMYDDATGTVTDWKTASVWKVAFNEWDDYRTQLLIYCWILRRMGFDARHGEIVAVLKDHSKTKAENDPSYPKLPVVVKHWDFTDGDLEMIGDWINAKMREIELCEPLEDDALPICSEADRWHREDKWAVKKRGNKKAAKLCMTEADAISAKVYYEDRDGKPYEVEFRPGEDTKCLKYCSAKAFCSFWKGRYGN